MAKSHQGLLWTGGICFLAAAGAFFLAREQERIRSLYGDAPQTISLAQLAEKGCGDNVWVDLTDVDLVPKFVVKESKGKISLVWAAAFAKGQADDAQEIKVILRSSRCRSDAEIAQKFETRESYRGAVINPILLWPHDPYRPLLKQAFPNQSLAQTIWEVDIDYVDKPTEKMALGFFIASGVLTVLGTFCSAAWILRRLISRPAFAGEELILAELQRSARN